MLKGITFSRRLSFAKVDSLRENVIPFGCFDTKMTRAAYVFGVPPGMPERSQGRLYVCTVVVPLGDVPGIVPRLL
jgi:hypothetical protein